MWFTRSTDGGHSWSEERVTPTPFDMRTAPVARGYFIGDYEGLSALGTTFYPFWSESRSSGTDIVASTLQAPSHRRPTRRQRPKVPACLGLPDRQGQTDPAVIMNGGRSTTVAAISVRGPAGGVSGRNRLLNGDQQPRTRPLSGSWSGCPFEAR